MMTHNEVVKLLAFIAASDRRTIGEADVEVWKQTMAAAGITSLADALQAVVEHHATSREFLMPIDVIERVKAIRAARLKAAPSDEEIMSDVAPSDPRYFEELKRRREIAASGGYELRAVTA